MPYVVNISGPSSNPGLAAARLTALGFLSLIIVGAILLLLPISSRVEGPTPILTALFTATSAVCLTGLIVVDTAGYWTPFGQTVIMLLIQVGGLGIMTLASLTGLLLVHKVSLHTRARTAAEGRPVHGGSARRAITAAVLLTLACEATAALIITLRLIFAYHLDPLTALWTGVFHAVSAFNNAGFSTYSDNMMGFAADWFILVPIMGALIIGGLGYPVMTELVRHARGRTHRRLSVTARMTLSGTVVLIVGGALALALAEHGEAFENLHGSAKVLGVIFAAVSPRTAGFNAIDYADMSSTGLMITEGLMFVGGGSAGTAGGLKITTVVVLAAAMHSEFRGESDVIVGKRKINDSVVRQAMTVAVFGGATVAAAFMALRVLNPGIQADYLAFEVISAFATVGLSAGVTADVTNASQVLLCLLMYLGRIGPITLVASLAATTVQRRYSYPDERPYIG